MRLYQENGIEYGQDNDVLDSMLIFFSVPMLFIILNYLESKPQRETDCMILDDTKTFWKLVFES